MRVNRFIKNMTKDRVLTMSMEPPEPRCARCGAYSDEEDVDDSGNWKCRSCGWDGTPDKCVVCGAWINPKSENFGYSICKTCEMGGQSQDENLEEWHEYLMRTYNQEEEDKK